MDAKKIRIIWQEQITQGQTNVKPLISFDKGYNWLELVNLGGQNLADEARLYNSSSKNIDCFYTELNNGYNEINVAFTPTFCCTPEISQFDTTPDENGFETGTWYFAVAAISNDYPLFEATSDVETVNKIDKGTESDFVSKIITVELTEPSAVNLYIKYQDAITGIAVYAGQASGSTIELKLVYLTNMVQSLAKELEETSGADDYIYLKNNYPLPNNGIVKIEDEYISYETCTRQMTDGQTYWALGGLRRSINSISQKHPKTNISLSENYSLEVFYTPYYEEGSDGLPPRDYNIPSIPNSLLYYLDCNSGVIKNIGYDSSSQPDEMGVLLYKEVSNMYGKAIKFNGEGIIDTQYQLNTPDASIYFLHQFNEFTENDADPYIIIGTSDYAKRLWIKISKTNLKPIIGYGADILIDDDDTRTVAFSRNSVDKVMLTYRLDSANEKTIFNFYMNNKMYVEFEYDIAISDMGNLYLGGLGTSDGTFSNTYLGYIDEFRIYNEVKDVEGMIDIYSDINYNFREYQGMITLSKDNTVQFVNNDNITYYEKDSVKYIGYQPLITPSFTVQTASVDDFGENYRTAIDNYLLENLEGVDNLKSLTYPMAINNIKLRFDLSSDTGNAIRNMFETPIIKNISVIVSNVTAD